MITSGRAQARHAFAVLAIAIAATLAVADAAWAAPPANDNFASATALPTTLPEEQAGSNVAATKEEGEPNHAGDPGGHSVWYSWTPAGNELIGVQSAGCFGSFDTLIGVYTGSAVNALAPVASNAGFSPSFDCFFSELPQAEFEATAGTTYWIAVDGRGGEEGSFHLKFNHTPPNDEFADAASISPEPPQFVTGTTRLATKQSGEPDHAGDPGGHSVWFSWTPASSGKIEIETCSTSSNIDALLAVYTGSSLATLTEGASNDEALGPERLPCRWSDSAVSFDAVAGTTYKIAVDGAGGSVGRFELKLRGGPQHGNDDFADAETISAPLGSFSVQGDNKLATKETGEPNHAGNPGGHSVWYSWTPVNSGQVRISTCATHGNLDALLAVYTGSSLGDLTAVAANDDAPNPHCRETDAAVDLDVSAATTYWIAVDGKSGSEGDFGLRADFAPPNDDFSDAIALPAEFSFSVSENTTSAGKETGEPDHAGDPGGHSVWFSWTPSASGPVTISACPYEAANPDTLLGVYTGTSVDNLTAVASNDDSPAACNEVGSEVEFNVTSGTTYWIAVDSKGGTEGIFSLNANGRPQNDDFIAAQVLSAEPIAPGGTTALATKQAGEPDHGGNPGGHSVWFSWTAPSSGPVAIYACGEGGVDTLLSAYTGSAVNSLTTVAGNDDAASRPDDGRCESSSGYSEVQFAAVSGTAYKIAVDTKNGVGRFAMGIERAPANDNFKKLTLLSRVLPAFGNGNNKLASKEAGEPNHAGDPGGHSVWYFWEAAEDGPIAISTCTNSGNLDTLLGVYEGAQVSVLQELVSNDDGPATASCRSTDSEVQFEAEAETQYAIAVDGKGGSTGSFQLLVEGRVPNDDFGHPQPLGGGLPAVWQFSSNRFATKQPNEPDHAGDPGGSSAWFKWTAPRTDTVGVETCGSSFDTLLAVYTGAQLESLTPVQSNDDGSGKCAPASRLSFSAVANRTYRIAVDGKGAAEGTMDLHIDGRPGNDDFEAAEKIPGSLGWYWPGATTLATKQAGEPGSLGGHSVWFSWTPRKNWTLELDACAKGFDPLLGIYTGSAVGSLTAVPASDTGGGECEEGSGVKFAAVAGVTYHLAVDGSSDEEGHFDLHLRGNAVATHSLTVARGGSGSGAVASSPAGIDCGTICSHDYAPGTVVTLTATPAAGSIFAGWSGAGCSGAGTCQVTLSSDASVSASFAPQESGGGSGGGPSPAPAPAPVPAPPSKPAPKPLKCRAGFKKTRVHGKLKCAKKKRAHHRHRG